MMQTGFQSLAEIVVSGVSWRNEDRCCLEHGPYVARVVFAAGKKVSDGICPVCQRLKEEAEAKEQAAEKAKLEAEKERQRLEEALGHAFIPADFKGKTFENFIADTPELKEAL